MGAVNWNLKDPRVSSDQAGRVLAVGRGGRAGLVRAAEVSYPNLLRVTLLHPMPSHENT